MTLHKALRILVLFASGYLMAGAVNAAPDSCTTNPITQTVSSSGATCQLNNTTSTINVGGSGQISSSGGSAIEVAARTANGSITNAGTITNNINLPAISIANGIVGSPTTTTINNSGTISSTYSSGSAISTLGLNTLNSITNSGVITGGSAQAAITNSGTLSITNTATMQAGQFVISNTGAINSLINSGHMVVSNSAWWSIWNQTSSTSIGQLTNTGNISGGGTYDIYNSGVIGTFNNSQGGDGLTAEKTELKYAGTLPTNYNIIIKSSTNYGQLAGASTPTGTMRFGVDGANSILPTNTTATQTTTYLNAIFSGITSSQVTNTIGTVTSSGIVYGYSLPIDGGNAWKLSITPTNITSGSYNATGLGSSFNPLLDGGELQFSSDGSVTNNFLITHNGGSIDQNGKIAAITGNITNSTDISGANTPGKLIVKNTLSGGGLTLSGINTYSGGTEVQSGANLIIGSASSLGSGTLALVGTPTTSATLSTTADMTISNPITVKYDPTFNVASGTTTTVSSVIADGGAPGDVVVAGGGTLNLTAVNTYTGLTTVDSGATLALSGTGSIAASSSVVDNGTFDISTTTSGAAVNAISGSGAVALGAKSLTVANAAGNLSGVVGGTGGLNITGGTQTLSGANTFSGGVQVQSGAALSIASSNALGSGALALIGSATVPATLNITDTTTIANAISVAGDPVFNITTGTTTTVSSPITDGGVAGDVVVAGGGTLNLTAVNSYTGLTAIGAGSTLALSGSGSITPSVSVTNNGTLNVTSKTGNVALGGSFTQTSSGSLVMGFSPTSNQRLQIAGAAVLAGSLSLQAAGGTYSAGKYTLLSANGLSGTFGTFSSNLSSYTNLAYLLGYDANDVYLTLFSNGPSTADTQQSLVNTAASLQSIYTLQNSVLANSLNYDCTEFGPHGICISVGGRNTAVSAANGLNNTSGLLIGAYRPHPNYRMGAYIDQNLSVNNAGSTVSLGNNTPVIGVFGAWNQNVDGTGAEVKVTAAYGQKNTTVTRSVVGTSEAGSGSSQLNSQGAQVVARYGFGVAENVIVNPYAGIRYTQNNMGGYTEGTSTSVTAPLTYSALNTNATTALAGVGASYRFIPQAMLFASAGIETDTNTANGTYVATGVSGLTPINFNANPVKTRPTATLGTYYNIEKNQRVGVTGIYRQEPYQGVSTTSVMATYTVGL